VTRISSPARRLGGSLALLVFGGVFLWWLVPEILANLRAARWTAATCTILSSDVETQESRDDDTQNALYRLAVRYRYETVAGTNESTRYRFVDPYTDNRGAVESAAARYHAGAIVPCHVDPDDATQAVLDRGVSPFLLVAVLPAGIAAVGAWGLLGLGADLLRGAGRVKPARGTG
jgi:hypothetical protein